MAGDFKVTVKLQAVKADITGLRRDVRAAFASPIPVKFSVSGAETKRLAKTISGATVGFNSFNNALGQSKGNLESVKDAKKRLSIESARLIAMNKADTAAQINAMKVDAARLVLNDKKVAAGRRAVQEEGRTYRERAREITNFSKMSDQANRYYTQYSKNISKNSVLNARWQATMSKLDDPTSYAGKTAADRTAAARAELAALTTESEKAGVSMETLGQRIGRLFSAHFNTALVMAALHGLQQAVVAVYQNVVALDKSTVDLQIASGKSRDEVKGMMRDYSQTAKSMGATTLEVAQSSDTWLRQGKTVQEANTLIQNSMMLSKLGQIDAETSAQSLTSAMKGYNVSVEDSIKIVDKLTAVDQVSASSAGGLAVSMSETAVSARIAGVSMDKLLGQLAAIKETTQDSDEAVGNFAKTMYSRMGNVKSGLLLDPEDGTILNIWGIAA